MLDLDLIRTMSSDSLRCLALQWDGRREFVTALQQVAWHPPADESVTAYVNRHRRISSRPSVPSLGS